MPVDFTNAVDHMKNTCHICEQLKQSLLVIKEFNITTICPHYGKEKFDKNIQAQSKELEKIRKLQSEDK